MLGVRFPFLELPAVDFARQARPPFYLDKIISLHRRQDAKEKQARLTIEWAGARACDKIVTFYK